MSLLTRSESEVSALLDSNDVHSDPFDMSLLKEEVKLENLQADHQMEEKPSAGSPELFSSVAASEDDTSNTGFLEPDEVSIPSVIAPYALDYHGVQRMKLLHNGVAIQLCCSQLSVRFGISTKFVDVAGRPRLNILVDATPSLSKVLDAIDSVAQKQFLEFGSSSSKWNPVVIRKKGCHPTIRLQ